MTSFNLFDWLGKQEVNAAIDSALKILATSVGLWWFLRRSLHRVRLNISQDIKVFSLEENSSPQIILKVFLQIENIGEVPFQLQKLSIGATQAFPLPEIVKEKLLTSSCIVDETATEAALDDRGRSENYSAWPSLATADTLCRKNWKIEVRPGETETIPATVQLQPTPADYVMVISQLTREKSMLKFWQEPLTWRVHSLLKVRGEEVIHMKNDSSNNTQAANQTKVVVSTPKASGADSARAGTPIKIRPVDPQQGGGSKRSR